MLGFLLPFSSHSSRSNVIEILEPFEIADSHSSGVAEDVGKELNSFFKEDLLAFEGSWTISSLDNQFCFEFISVVNIN